LSLRDVITGREARSYLMAIVMAFIGALVLMALAGTNPFSGIYLLIAGALGNVFGLSETLVKLTPILLASLGCVIAFKAKVWNIGAEGQLYIGALTTAWVGTMSWVPPGLGLPLVIIASFVVAGSYALIAAVLKVKRGVNEVISTIMMNYIAYWVAHYFIHWPPLRDPNQPNPQTLPILPGSSLPILISGTRLHSGILIAVVATVLVYVLLTKTKLGYEIKITGSNPSAATYGGIKVWRVVLVAMFLSGGLAGLAGMGEVAGLHGYLLDDISPSYGYIAALVALFGRLNVFGVFLGALFVSILFNGADIAQISLYLPKEIADVIVSIMVLLVISREIFLKRGVPKR